MYVILVAIWGFYNNLYMAASYNFYLEAIFYLQLVKVANSYTIYCGYITRTKLLLNAGGKNQHESKEYNLKRYLHLLMVFELQK